LKIIKKYFCFHVTEHYAVKICGEVELIVHRILKSAAVGIESDKL